MRAVISPLRRDMRDHRCVVGCRRDLKVVEATDVLGRFAVRTKNEYSSFRPCCLKVPRRWTI
jgi:hypothetical protein